MGEKEVFINILLMDTGHLQMNGINWDNNAASEVLGQGVGAQHSQYIPAH